METTANEPELKEEKPECSFDLENPPMPTCPEFQEYVVLNKTNPALAQFTNSLSQLRSQYRKLKRMHPYADEKMKMKVMLSKILADVTKKYQMKNLELQQEIVAMQNSFGAYKDQINWQEEHFKLLEEQIKTKDERIKCLEKECNSYKNDKNDRNEWEKIGGDQEFQIQVQDERIKALEDELKQIKVENFERVKTLENELKLTKDESVERIEILENELRQTKDKNTTTSDAEKELTKSHDDRVQALEKELADLNDRVKKQEMQIQSLEVDLKYKDEAEAAHSENAQRQDMKCKVLANELNRRRATVTMLIQENKKLKNTVNELTKSAARTNLILNNILKDVESETRDGCSESEDVCCETLKLCFINLVETEFECVICNGMFIEATITTCNHMFCNYCLQMWKKKSPNCPICRSFVKFEMKTTVIDNYIMNTAKLMSEKMLTDRKKLIEERKQAVYEEVRIETHFCDVNEF